MKRTYLILILPLTLLFSACTPKPAGIPTPAPITAAANAVWVYHNGYVHHGTGQDLDSAPKFTVPTQYQPVTYEYGKTFQVSTDNQYVVWFVPTAGLIRLNQQTGVIDAVYQPTQWFYENPFFQFLGDTHQIILIDKKGSEVITLDLDTGKSRSQSIPYPFGSVFRLSPDLKKVLYIEGYRQTSGRPKYLITDMNGQELAQITTDAEVSDRALVGWSADSSQIITVEMTGSIVAYDFQAPHSKSVLYTFSEDERVIDFTIDKQYLFINSRSYWYLFDTAAKKIIHRLPIEAMANLNRPKYVTANAADSFYIEETIQSFESSYKRLWQSDWMGNKSIVIPRYGIETVQTVSY